MYRRSFEPYVKVVDRVWKVGRTPEGTDFRAIKEGDIIQYKGRDYKVTGTSSREMGGWGWDERSGECRKQYTYAEIVTPTTERGVRHKLQFEDIYHVGGDLA